MRLSIALVVAIVIALAVPAATQTTTAKLQWTQPLVGSQTFADVQAFTWTLKVDATAPAAVVPTCVAGTPIVCAVPLPVLPSAPHTFTITAANGFGSASSSLSGNPPAAATTITIVVSVTVP